MESLISLVSRIFLLAASASIALLMIERIANATGYTILGSYRGAHWLDAAVALLVFVIAAQLREVKEAIKKRP